MDEFIDQFFSPSAWTDDKAPETSPWVCDGPDQTNGLLPDTKEVYKGNEINLTPSGHIVDSLITNDPSMFVCVDSSFDIEKNSLPGEPEPIQGGTDSLQDIIDGNLNPSYRDRHLKTPPTLLPDDTGPAESPSVQPESGSVGSNDSELSEIQPPLRDLQSLTSLPQAWPASSYGGDSSLLPIAGHDIQSLGLKGQYVETDAAFLWNNNLKDNTAMQGNLPGFLSVNGQHELTDRYISSAAGYKFPLGRTAEIHPSYQLNEGNPVNHYTEQSPVSQLQHDPTTGIGGCNGAAKPRVRARRGQATDPHSIAERLRREKIAERMKNLQELVPNSSKTDKASMLDEIIEYVKFLQLQVKVLSMSRLGAAGAVVPLITDSQTEGSTGLLVSPSAGYGVDPFESPNDIAFEQEVVKLMEANMTAAIQFLHKKGLCLMPIALAAAISSSKASSGSICPEGKKPTLTNGLVHQSNGEPNTGKDQISSKGEIRSKENTFNVLSIKGIPTDGCNGSNSKEEEVMNIVNSTREMNPEVP